MPGLTAPVIGALYSPSDGHADPTRSTKAFEMAARESGVEVLTNCAALDIETKDGRVTSVKHGPGQDRYGLGGECGGGVGEPCREESGAKVSGADHPADAGDNRAGVSEDHALRAGSRTRGSGRSRAVGFSSPGATTILGTTT